MKPKRIWSGWVPKSLRELSSLFLWIVGLKWLCKWPSKLGNLKQAMANSQREDGIGNKAQSAVHPVGYPAIVYIFFYSLRIMYSCGLLLKSSGFTIKTWIANTYHNFGVRLKGRTLRKPLA